MAWVTYCCVWNIVVQWLYEYSSFHLCINILYVNTYCSSISPCLPGRHVIRYSHHMDSYCLFHICTFLLAWHLHFLFLFYFWTLVICFMYALFYVVCLLSQGSCHNWYSLPLFIWSVSWLKTIVISICLISAFLYLVCFPAQDPCNNHACQNGATCVAESCQNYSCSCPACKTGDYCEIGKYKP